MSVLKTNGNGTFRRRKKKESRESMSAYRFQNQHSSFAMQERWKWARRKCLKGMCYVRREEEEGDVSI